MLLILSILAAITSSALATSAECNSQGGTCLRWMNWDSCSGTLDSDLCGDLTGALAYSCCIPNGAGGGGGDGGNGGDIIIPEQGECGLVSNARIVGGETAQEGSWPWQASLHKQGSTGSFSHICGGSLIYHGWVVTAAHCVDDSAASPSNYRIVMGEHHQKEDSGNEQYLQIAEIIKHENYNAGSSGYPNDIALLRLADDASTVSAHVGLACIPRTSDQEFTVNDECYITGWGKTSGDDTTIPDELQEVRIDVRSNSECSSAWGFTATILDTHICVGDGYPTACNGDSGGPLVCVKDGRHVLAGVTSWGYRGCTTKPAVYTRVSKYRSWIAGKVGA